MISPLLRGVLFLAFFLSGCSGLIYQTVWVRMLTRYVGATTYATATVLAVFMAGLALGGYLGGRYADRARRPLLGYALLEIAIAAAGLLASFVVIRGLSTYYVSFYDRFGAGPAAVLMTRVVFIVCCLLPPTVLMGATLPILVAYVSRLGQQLQVGLAQLYAINTLGAVAGVLAAGLVLIGELGESASLGVAAALNLVAAILIFGLRAPQDAAPAAPVPALEPAEALQVYSPPVRRLALAAFLVSGFSALAYEILWTRFLVLVLHTSIYAFSTMLGAFLAGIALGSMVASRGGLRRAPLARFGLLEILIAVWTVAGLLLLPVGNHLWLAVASWTYGDWVQVAVGGLICVVLVFPIAFLFGLQFPVAVRCCQRELDAPGRTTGGAYAANTLGTILGALSAGFLLIPLLGTTRTMVLVAALNLLLGLLLLLAAPAPERARRLVPALGLVGTFAVLAFLVGDPYRSVMLTRIQEKGSGWEIFRSYERAAATTISAGDRAEPNARSLIVNGTGMTALFTETKLMAHLPYLLAEEPRRFLVICFGMGTTYRSACLYPELRVDAVDIVPEVFDCFGDFHADAERWRNRPHAYRHVDDGRHYLLIHPEKYDVITIDPAPPLHSAGSVNLYTKEFFQLCKDHLTPGGVLCLWVPPEPETETLMVMRSFLEVFPEMTLWGALEFPGFYLIGGHRALRPTPPQLADLVHKLGQIEDLGEWRSNVDYTLPRNLEKLYLTDAAGLARLVEGVRPVTDDRPYTEFPLWRRLFLREARRPFDADKARHRLHDQAEKK